MYGAAPPRGKRWRAPGGGAPRSSESRIIEPETVRSCPHDQTYACGGPPRTLTARERLRRGGRPGTGPPPTAASARRRTASSPASGGSRARPHRPAVRRSGAAAARYRRRPAGGTGTRGMRVQAGRTARARHALRPRVVRAPRRPDRRIGAGGIPHRWRRARQTARVPARCRRAAPARKPGIVAIVALATYIPPALAAPARRAGAGRSSHLNRRPAPPPSPRSRRGPGPRSAPPPARPSSPDNGRR